MAEINLQPAKLGLASSSLPNVTTNRRAGVSPNVTPGMVDEGLGVIRVDKTSGAPLAVVWNFAVHGTAYDATNLKFSGDIMGAAVIALLAPMIAQKVVTLHAGIIPQSTVALKTASEVVPFGKATLDLSLSRLAAGSTDLDLPTLIATLLPQASSGSPFKMGPDWFENNYRFQAIRINDTLITTEAEYNIGGYEGIATFFGPKTADKVRAAALSQILKVQ